MPSSYLAINPLMLQYHKVQLSGDAPSNIAATESVKDNWQACLLRGTFITENPRSKLVQLLKLLMKVVNLSLIRHSMFCMLVNKLRSVYHWWCNSARPLFSFQIQTTREGNVKKFWSNVREFEIRGVRGSTLHHHGNKQHICWRWGSICHYIRVYTSPVVFPQKSYSF